MSKPMHHPDDHALIRRLRQEAREERPAFSESLHERTCRAIGERRTAARPAGRRGGRWLRVVVAAACAVAIAVVAWQALGPRDLPRHGGGNPSSVAKDHPQTPPTPAVAAVAATDPVSDLADEALGQLGDMVDSAVTIQQWAYLDHDARLAAEMLTDHLPLVQLAQEP